MQKTKTVDTSKIDYPKGIFYVDTVEVPILPFDGAPTVPFDMKEFMVDLMEVDREQVKVCNKCGWKTWIRVSKCSNDYCDNETDFHIMTEEELSKRRERITENIKQATVKAGKDMGMTFEESKKKFESFIKRDSKDFDEVFYLRLFCASFGNPKYYKG